MTVLQDPAPSADPELRPGAGRGHAGLADLYRSQAHRHQLHGHGVRLLPHRGAAGLADAGAARPARAEPRRRPTGTTSCSRCTASIMLFLFIGPFAFGLANYLVPLQVGARDMAFPRLNAFSYWLYLGGGITMVSGFATADGAAAFGWFGYTPLSDPVHSPGLGGDLWIAGLVLTGFSGILTAVNILTTVFCLRTPTMNAFRMPIFTWDMVVTSHPGAAGLPGADRGRRPAVRRPAPRRPRLRPGRRWRARSCGSTCSGSSGTPRCTSWCCPTSG